MASNDPMPRLNIWRLGLLVLLIAALAFGISQGWHEAFSARAIADRIDDLQMFVQDNLLWAIGAFVCTYIIIVSLSLPGAALMTLLIGFLFGWQLGAPMVVISATIGATVIFLIAKTALGDVLRARAGPFLDRIAHGFQRNAFNYLLFLRLVPLFPFWLINIAPAFLGVRLRTFVVATLLGIIPGTFAYSYAGGSLDSIFEAARSDEGFQTCLAEEVSGTRAEGSCALPVDLSDLITREILIALIILGLVSLIPVILRAVARNRDMEGIEE